MSDSSNNENKTPSIHILIVEDNAINQKVIFNLLQRLGYQSDITQNGQEALEATQNRTYDLVFMDVQMPIMDGYEATKRIREDNARYSNIPIIAMTANAMRGDRETCLAAGMDDYISKPIKKQELESLLDNWLQNNKQPIKIS